MKLLVVCPNWVGDAVMATPTLRALRRLYPQARITGLMRPVIAETLAGNPWIDDVVLYDSKIQGLWSTARRLREERFDLAVLLANSVRSALLVWLAAVTRRVGYAREGRGILLNNGIRIRRPRGGYPPSPLVDYYLALASHLGAPTESVRLELFTAPDDDARAAALWRKFGFGTSDRVAVLNPGSAYGPAKRWPSEYFSELARRLVDQDGCKVLILCGPGEQGLARFIADASLRPRKVRSMAQEAVSVGLSKAVVKRANLMVSTDSGPRHFAAAWDVPVVTLFGPTHIAWTDTHYERETFLQQAVPCGPCQQRVCPLGHHRCMKELTVDVVHAAASAALARWARQVA